MTEPESMMQTRGMSGKAKAVFKRSKAEAPSETASRERQKPGRTSSTDSRRDETSGEQDPHIIARIQQRAYWLYEASGFEEGRALEHWLEAERQVTGSPQRQSNPPSTEQS
jgi:hypothetical protein